MGQAAFAKSSGLHLYLGGVGLNQLEVVATLAALGGALFQHHPADERGIFIAYRGREREQAKKRCYMYMCSYNVGTTYICIQLSAPQTLRELVWACL